ncbi:MAG: Lrp/AsnC family transcriptional regulator [Methylobacteriaceae bacterium]|nr:Lrp/AsnC family transcriptional regulator [Methylobacteriaceae bacterium]
MPELDDLDRQIIAALRENARLSNLELATLVPLSHSAISRRVRRLEADGVLLGYHARVAPAAIGAGLRAFVAVQRQPTTPAIDVTRALATREGVVGAWILSGEFDVMIELVARDMPHYSAIMLEQVQTAPGVAATRSMFVLSSVRER